MKSVCLLNCWIRYNLKVSKILFSWYGVNKIEESNQAVLIICSSHMWFCVYVTENWLSLWINYIIYMRAYLFKWSLSFALNEAKFSFSTGALQNPWEPWNASGVPSISELVVYLVVNFGLGTGLLIFSLLKQGYCESKKIVKR